MRRSVVAVSTLVLAVALLLAGVLLRSQLRAALEQSITDQTVTRADAIAELAASGELETSIEPSERAPGWVQLVDANGTVYASTPNAAQLKRPITPPPITDQTTTRQMRGLSVDPDDLIVVAFVPTKVDGNRRVVIAAAPLDLADATDRRVTTVLLTMFPLLTGLAGAVSWIAARRALRPVEAIRAQMNSISATTELTTRVPVPASNDEIARLATTVNSTLDRLERSAKRQRQFVSDASHELRSPLASLRNQLEASLLNTTDPEWLTTGQGMIIDHDRLERLVADLLFLARHDEGERHQREAVDLGHLVRQEISRRPPASGIVTHVRAENAIVLANDNDLARVLRNLVDNAERHAASTVTLTVTAAGDSVELRVANDGPAIPVSELDRIFERFRRLDEARSSDIGGSGLGLAIVHELVTDVGGTVEAERTTEGASFLVRLKRVR